MSARDFDISNNSGMFFRPNDLYKIHINEAIVELLS